MWTVLGSTHKQVAALYAANQSAATDDAPYAELWMGTHPSGPSVLAGSPTPLKAAIEAHPSLLLGDAVHARSVGPSPFCLPAFVSTPRNQCAGSGRRRSPGTGATCDSSVLGKQWWFTLVLSSLCRSVRYVSTWGLTSVFVGDAVHIPGGARSYPCCSRCCPSTPRSPYRRIRTRRVQCPCGTPEHRRLACELGTTFQQRVRWQRV